MTVRRRLALVTGGVVLACAVVVAALLRPSDKETTRPPAAPKPKPTLKQVRGLAARVAVGDRIALRARPGGRILARVGGRTEFGSPQTLDVALRKGEWLAVRSPALENDQLGWVNTKNAHVRLLRREASLEVDLSARTLRLIERGVVRRQDAVGIGAPDTPTPTGAYYVTDKLPGPRFGSFYGCCILALSGRQPNLPEGWSGGDRLAIHGTPTPTFGEAVTNGCLHLPGEVLAILMKDVPLGARVVVHA